MTYKFKKTKQGFTLIETLVAVLLLATAIAGPLTIASKGLTSALVAKDQITAYFLVQDAIEYIRYMRDTSCLTEGDMTCGTGAWLSSFSPCQGGSGCYLDSTENSPATPTACQSGGCIQSTFASSRFLCYDPTTFRYTNGTLVTTCPAGATKTIYARQIKVDSPVNGSNDEALLTVTVSWSDMAGIVRSVTMREHLRNWQ